MDPLAELRLDHVGIEVPNLEAAIKSYVELFGYRVATTPVINQRHQFEVVFLEKPGSLPIKLIHPLRPSKPTPGRLHHLAFHTDALTASIEALVARGAHVLNAPEPGEAFDDEPIAFLYAGGINVQLVTTNRWRNRLPKPASSD